MNRRLTFEAGLHCLMNETAQSASANQSLRRFSGIELLIAVAALFISFPFVENLRAGPLLESILLTLVLISAVLAISGRRRILVTATVLALATCRPMDSPLPTRSAAS